MLVHRWETLTLSVHMSTSLDSSRISLGVLIQTVHHYAIRVCLSLTRRELFKFVTS